jgi:hypothetical protein
MKNTEVAEGRPQKIAELLSPTFLEKVRQATLIEVIDEETGKSYSAYGRAAAKRIVMTGECGNALLLRISILVSTDERECLIMAIRHVKGSVELELIN